MTSKQTIKFARLQLAQDTRAWWWFSIDQTTLKVTRRAGAVTVKKGS